jgi:hypothetical protein
VLGPGAHAENLGPTERFDRIVGERGILRHDCSLLLEIIAKRLSRVYRNAELGQPPSVPARPRDGTFQKPATAYSSGRK